MREVFQVLNDYPWTAVLVAIFLGWLAGTLRGGGDA